MEWLFDIFWAVVRIIIGFYTVYTKLSAILYI